MRAKVTRKPDRSRKIKEIFGFVMILLFITFLLGEPARRGLADLNPGISRADEHIASLPNGPAARYSAGRPEITTAAKTENICCGKEKLNKLKRQLRRRLAV